MGGHSTLQKTAPSWNEIPSCSSSVCTDQKETVWLKEGKKGSASHPPSKKWEKVPEAPVILPGSLRQSFISGWNGLARTDGKKWFNNKYIYSWQSCKNVLVKKNGKTNDIITVKAVIHLFLLNSYFYWYFFVHFLKNAGLYYLLWDLWQPCRSFKARDKQRFICSLLLVIRPGENIYT